MEDKARRVGVLFAFTTQSPAVAKNLLLCGKLKDWSTIGRDGKQSMETAVGERGKEQWRQ